MKQLLYKILTREYLRDPRNSRWANIPKESIKQWVSFMADEKFDSIKLNDFKEGKKILLLIFKECDSIYYCIPKTVFGGGGFKNCRII